MFALKSPFTLFLSSLFSILTLASQSPSATLHEQQESLQSDALWNSNITQSLFQELGQLVRIVDISYCVGISGISKPFACNSYCKQLPNFELVDTFQSSYFVAGNAGYIALDHGSDEGNGRILVAYRGTFSISDAIMDMMLVPQKYVPYPSYSENINTTESKPQTSNNKKKQWSFLGFNPRLFRRWNRPGRGQKKYHAQECTNCTVHMGFWESYQMIRPFVISKIISLQNQYPNYQIHLVGHSLGGAVAALTALELVKLGYKPIVTTFGEPRIGNKELANFIDTSFNLRPQNSNSQTGLPSSNSRYRRVTHIEDPVPLLPPQNFGYRSHAGEVFISKKNVPAAINDVRLCFGGEDVNCIAGTVTGEAWKDFSNDLRMSTSPKISTEQGNSELRKRSKARIVHTELWLPIVAHLSYFHLLKLCATGGDLVNWKAKIEV